MRSDEEVHERLASRMEPVFDLDIYKIMTRFLEGKRKGGESSIDIVRLGRSTARQLALELEEPA